MKIILFCLLWVLSTISVFSEDRKFLFRDQIVQSSDAFSMLGDSRTQYVFELGAEVDWEDKQYLGKYKTSCSESKAGIQNAGVAGSTTEHWLEFLKSENYKPEDFHQNIVLMIGGNDIIRYSYKWRGFTFNKTDALNNALDEIHTRVVEIVNILRQSNKKVIIQTHFRVNPAIKEGNSKSLNEGIDGLNLRLLETYGKDLDGDVTVAYIPPEFPAALFLDLVHLNPFGYQLHSYFLARELERRCWW